MSWIITILVALAAVGMLFLTAAHVPQKLRRLFLGGSVILLFMLACGNWLLCRSLAGALGGSALIGGVDSDGRYYLREHAKTTPVSKDLYLRLYRYEAISQSAFNIAFWSFTLMWVSFVVAHRLGRLPIASPQEAIQRDAAP